MRDEVPIDEAFVERYITTTFAGAEVVQLVTNDAHDSASNLSRPSVFRLNIGVSRGTFRSLFGVSPSAGAEVTAGHDFTALDRLLPHPVYAVQSWVCILNPGQETFRSVERLLEEAHRLSVERQAKRTTVSGK